MAAVVGAVGGDHCRISLPVGKADGLFVAALAWEAKYDPGPFVARIKEVARRRAPDTRQAARRFVESHGGGLAGVLGCTPSLRSTRLPP